MTSYLNFIVRWPNVNVLTLVDILVSFKNDYNFDLELDFDLMGIEVEEMDEDKAFEEIKE